MNNNFIYQHPVTGQPLAPSTMNPFLQQLSLIPQEIMASPSALMGLGLMAGNGKSPQPQNQLMNALQFLPMGQSPMINALGGMATGGGFDPSSMLPFALRLLR